MNKHRKMKFADYKKQQWKHRYDPHIKPINDLVNNLKRNQRSNIPYIDPQYGGVNSEILFLLQNPGPKTDIVMGSGFLSPENDDPSADLFSTCLEYVKLPVNRVMVWNAFPWGLPPSQKQPNSKQIEMGLDPLYQLLILLPKIKVVIKMGKCAEKSWEKFTKKYSIKAISYRAISSLLTSPRGITNGGQHKKSKGVQKVCAVIHKAFNFINK